MLLHMGGASIIFTKILVSIFNHINFIILLDKSDD